VVQSDNATEPKLPHAPLSKRRGVATRWKKRNGIEDVDIPVFPESMISKIDSLDKVR
jgi:hypothetical protein